MANFACIISYLLCELCELGVHYILLSVWPKTLNQLIISMVYLVRNTNSFPRWRGLGGGITYPTIRFLPLTPSEGGNRIEYSKVFFSCKHITNQPLISFRPDTTYLANLAHVICKRVLSFTTIKIQKHCQKIIFLG